MLNFGVISDGAGQCVKGCRRVNEGCGNFDGYNCCRGATCSFSQNAPFGVCVEQCSRQGQICGGYGPVESQSVCCDGFSCVLGSDGQLGTCSK